MLQDTLNVTILSYSFTNVFAAFGGFLIVFLLADVMPADVEGLVYLL